MTSFQPLWRRHHLSPFKYAWLSPTTLRVGMAGSLWLGFGDPAQAVEWTSGHATSVLATQPIWASLEDSDLRSGDLRSDEAIHQGSPAGPEALPGQLPPPEEVLYNDQPLDALLDQLDQAMAEATPSTGIPAQAEQQERERLEQLLAIIRQREVLTDVSSAQDPRPSEPVLLAAPPPSQIVPSPQTNPVGIPPLPTAIQVEQERLEQLLTDIRQQTVPAAVITADPTAQADKIYSNGLGHTLLAQALPLDQTTDSPPSLLIPALLPLQPQEPTPLAQVLPPPPSPAQVSEGSSSRTSGLEWQRERLDQLLNEVRQQQGRSFEFEPSEFEPGEFEPGDPSVVESEAGQQPSTWTQVLPISQGQSSPTEIEILSPTLEQNQLPDVLRDPVFSAPPLSDLPSANFNTPEIRDQLLQPQPFLGQLNDQDIVRPLQRHSLVPFPALRPPEPVAATPSTAGRYLSPLERPMTRLFGFETADPLRQGELVLTAGGNSFGNPQDFRTVLGGDTNRSNDIRVGLDYGITDQLQFSIGAEGKDDTIFANLIGDNTGVSVIYQGIPAQLKWQMFEGERLSSALVLGAQFAANTVPGNSINQALSTSSSSRKIILTTDINVNNALLAEDSSVYYSVAAPITYQWSPRIRLHANPQVSVFPDRIPVSIVRGSSAELADAGIGFDGDSLKYFGTVVGLGLGLDYDISPVIQFSADITPILAGANTLDAGGDDSLFVPRSVWNAGVRWTPNSRLGVNFYYTNRFGPLTASPANILGQPGGGSGVGLDFIYLPDLIGEYTIAKRNTYPEAPSFLSGLNGMPSTTLPLGSVLYELAAGSQDRFTQTVRLGVLDDLELVGYRDVVGNDTFPVELGFLGRLALVGDRGRPGVTAAITAGALGFEGTDSATDVALYGDLALGYRARSEDYSVGVTPKFLVPTEASGRGNTLGVTLDGRWNVGESTQILGSYTPVLEGENQLLSGLIGDRARPPEGNVSLYTLGVRQLFETDNSLYALDLFVSNASGSYGQQGLLGLPDGQNQVGVRFSALNGIPSNTARSIRESQSMEP